MEKISRKRFIAWVAFAVSFIIVLYGLSNPVITQFPYKTLDKYNVIDYSFNDNGGAVVTNSEMYFIDRNGAICNIVTLIDIDIPFNYVQAISVDKKGYTLLGYYYPPGAQNPDRVILAHCDSHGNHIHQIWSQDTEENGVVCQKYISDIKVLDDRLFVVSHDGKNLTISNYSDPADWTEQKINVYSEENTQYIQNVVFGESVDELYLQNRFGNNSLFTVSNGNHKECPELKHIRYTWFDEKALNTSYPYSASMWIKTVLFYLSAATLLVLVLSFLVKLGRMGVLNRIRTAMFVLVAVGIALIFFISNIGRILKAKESDDVLFTANRAKSAFEQISEQKFPLPDSPESTDAFFEDPENRSAINELLLFVQNFCNAENKQSVSFIKIILLDNAGNNCIYVDSEDQETCGKPSRYIDFLTKSDPDKSDDLITIDAEDSEYRIAYRKIDTDKNTYDVIVAVATDDLSNLGGLVYEIMYEVYQFIAIILSVYIALEFFSNCFGNVSEYKKKREMKDRLAGISLSNIFIFCVEIVCNLDYFLLVMVTADICKNASPAQLALFLALPLTTYRIGSLIGSSLTGWITDKIGYRKSAVTAAVFTIAAFVLMAYSCMVKNIYLLSFSKFMQGIFLDSILFTLADGLPYQIEDREDRERRIARCQSAENAGIVLSIMAGGVISQYISYTAMYIIGAIVSVIFIVFAFLVFHKGMDEATEEEQENGENTGRSPWAVFIRPKTILFLVMVIVPYVLVQGYEDYLFPLFSESKGLNEMTLSSIGVIANSLSYYGERILVFFQNLPKSFAIVISLCICGILLMLLAVSPGITWAVIVLIGINIITRVIDAHRITYIADLSKDEGYDPIEIQERYYPIEDTIRIIQAPLLGAFATVGSVFACVITGLISFLVPGGYEAILHFPGKKNRRY